MQIALGGTGLVTSALALGCARIGSALTPLGRRECVALIDEAFRLGVRHFDTASIYGQGDSERYLGEALAARRDEVCLSSKAGNRLTLGQSMLAAFKRPIRWLAARRGNVRRGIARQRAAGVPSCFEPDFIERSLRASLRRLRTGHLDIFYLHSPPPAVLDDGALMARLAALRAAGLFRVLGVSCDNAAIAWHAAAHEAVQVVQFAVEDPADGLALLRELARRGKHAVLRGLMHAPLSTVANNDTLSTRFRAALDLPAIGGVLVGTTDRRHLRENVAAFRQALAMKGAGL